MAEIKVRVMRMIKKRMVVAVVAVGPFINRVCRIVVPENCLASSSETCNIRRFRNLVYFLISFVAERK